MRQDAPSGAERSLRGRISELEARIPELERAAAEGDLPAQAALVAAREELARAREVLSSGPVEVAPGDPEVVEEGDVVSVREVETGAVTRYTIVSPTVSRLDASWISSESPLARAILGRRAGDTVTVEAPGGKIRYTVESIETR